MMAVVPTDSKWFCPSRYIPLVEYDQHTHFGTQRIYRYLDDKESVCRRADQLVWWWSYNRRRKRLLRWWRVCWCRWFVRSVRAREFQSFSLFQISLSLTARSSLQNQCSSNMILEHQHEHHTPTQVQPKHAGFTWLEPWQVGIDTEGRGAPISPHDGSNNAMWELTAQRKHWPSLERARLLD